MPAGQRYVAPEIDGVEDGLDGKQQVEQDERAQDRRCAEELAGHLLQHRHRRGCRFLPADVDEGPDKGQRDEPEQDARYAEMLRRSSTRSIHLSEFSIRGFAETNSSAKMQLSSTGTTQAASPLANAGRLKMANASRASLNGATTKSSRRARSPLSDAVELWMAQDRERQSDCEHQQQKDSVSRYFHRRNQAGDRNDNRGQRARSIQRLAG